MENNDVNINSCLMWMMNLDTPVDFSAIFDEKDLKDTGIELDSHMTLLYAQNKIIEKDNLLSDIKNLLGEEYDSFNELCKEEHSSSVFSMFDLDMFENDSDYIILKLKNDSEIYDMMKIINKGLCSRYQVKPDFLNYTPHITLAELQPGTARNYMNSETLRKVLEDSYVDFEDISISYGTAKEVHDRKQYFLTSYKCTDRYFRIQNLIESSNGY